MDGHPLASIPPLKLHDGVNRDEINASDIVADWLAALEKRPKNGLSTDLSDLFIDDCWWRDFTALSWDIVAKHGLEDVAEYLTSSTTGFGQLTAIKTGGLQASLVDMHGAIWIQGGFTFQTSDGSGTGLVRLINVDKSHWKAWTVFTQLERLHSQDELDKQRMRQSYTQTRIANGVNGEKEGDLQVLIIGAGQSGLMLAAQLKNMGIKALLVDKLPRLGDMWRSRYETIRTHTPIYLDHYPFLRFPTNWPRWREQDKIASWMEHYGQVMGLDYMLSTTVNKIDYDEQARRYTVEVENEDGKHVFQPRHLVLATGVFSHHPIEPEIPGRGSFKGEIYHSMHHKAARLIPDLANKHVAIIGSGTSAHDIAQDFVNSGAKDVSIVQRNAIFSVSATALEDSYLSMWNTPGISTEEADIIGNSFPTAVARTLNIGQTQMMEEHDQELLAGLEKAGLKLKRAKTAGYGFIDHLLVKAGHFYIEQGASQMIVDGRIKVHQCDDGVKEFVSDGFILADGKKVQADLVVLATGYQRNILTVEELMGKKVAEKVGDLGYLDNGQERIGWWRPTGFPGFWYMTGSFVWGRQFSPVLALQITAIEQGLNPGYWEQTDRDNKGIGTVVHRV
ncbi:uncharacterized protein Z520_01471 [Fonsecaea multimorphosa CBS 102226]|uniref:FAD/NAD(P)-binding domain-containing protein n=1 Tax=Fonsecaea multimorphosa CBS 102226 TaxID=1442371 RepID=A0A0D2KHT8_9EURO|nr:uncharacterized protein Z520_01471 [Fonsecaea multimorphosa CBS 102226]KIY03005.1 hypothetical protein Z520_01471 [Fonsecaea multimorphosa CBS 102226]OAL30835.1 hypothetical protein AYO22_01455 [Fonsecaea multimorphosa]